MPGSLWNFGRPPSTECAGYFQRSAYKDGSQFSTTSFSGNMAQEDSLERRTQFVFLLLILTQAAHSVEEYVTRLYDVFAPARFVSSLISSNLALGFVVANTVLVCFGLWCWAFPVRSGWSGARGLIWFWTILELGNGLGHSFFAISRGGYFPGAITAPLLLFFSVWLVVLQIGARAHQSIQTSGPD